MLLNKSSGRIDVHLLMLFSIDAVFQRGKALIDATARMYEPFGSIEQAAALFANFDPLKAHCGLTNAVIADHVDNSLDGRDDYRRLLGVRPHSFFVSNSSDNMRYLTPLEVQHHMTGKAKEFAELPMPHKLEDFPQWVIGPGAIEADHRTALRKYRTRAIPRSIKQDNGSWHGGVLNKLLGLHSSAPNEESWTHMVSKLGSCAEVTLAGSRPWQEPGQTIDARPVVDSYSATGGNGAETAAAAPSWLDSSSQEKVQPPVPSGYNWKHTLDLIPGSDFNEPPPPVYQATPAAASQAAPQDAPKDAPKAAPPVITGAFAAEAQPAAVAPASNSSQAQLRSPSPIQEEKMSDAMACRLSPDIPPPSNDVIPRGAQKMASSLPPMR
jgi:hypothetical protein